MNLRLLRSILVDILIALALLLILGTAPAKAQTVTTTVNIGWTAPTLNTDGSTIVSSSLTYMLFQGPKAGPFTQVATGLSAVSSTVTSLTAGNCFVVAAVEAQGTNGSSSVPSAISGSTCVLQPNAPGNLTVSVTVTVH